MGRAFDGPLRRVRRAAETDRRSTCANRGGGMSDIGRWRATQRARRWLAAKREDDGLAPPGLGVRASGVGHRAVEAFRHGESRRIRLYRERRRRAGDPRGRGDSRLSCGDAEKFAGTYRSARAVSHFGHVGDRRGEPPQFGNFAHDPRGTPRRVALVGARSDDDRDGLAAPGRVDRESADRYRRDRRAARGGRGVGRGDVVVRRRAGGAQASLRRRAAPGPRDDWQGESAGLEFPGPHAAYAAGAASETRAVSGGRGSFEIWRRASICARMWPAS
jgi:hypothetical protein